MSGISRKLMSGGERREDITYVDSTSTTDTNTLSLTGITGLSEGDLVVVIAQQGTGSITVTSTGWSSFMPSFPSSENNVAIRNLLFYKVMGSTPDTSVTFTGLPRNSGAAAFRGCKEAAITTHTFNVNGSGTASSLDPNALIIAYNNSLAVQCAWIDDDNSTYTPSTGFTTAFQQPNNSGSMAMSYKVDVDAGTLDPDSLSWSSADNLLARQVVFEAAFL